MTAAAQTFEEALTQARHGDVRGREEREKKRKKEEEDDGAGLRLAGGKSSVASGKRWAEGETWAQNAGSQQAAGGDGGCLTRV